MQNTQVKHNTKIATSFFINILLLVFKNKKCADKSRHTKTQTPIVAKLTLMNTGNTRTLYLSGICILTKSANIVCEKYAL